MQSLDFNTIDYIILAALAFYAYEGYASGFIGALLDLGNFILSFVMGLRFYGLIAGILVDKLSVPPGFSNAIGFFIATFVTEVIIGFLIRKYFSFDFLAFRSPAPSGAGRSGPPLKKINKTLGILPGLLSGAILIAFILILVVALPVPGPIKNAISLSKVGNLLLVNAQVFEKDLNKVFGGAISETINFLTVEPKSSESVSLHFKTSNASQDSPAEQYMLKLVNKERAARGLKEVIFDDSLRDVGRAHCKDMFERGYFSHYTPEGFSPFDRMDEAGIVYNTAGENLALSPNADIAMQGLMNSPGHKANILSSDFGKVGVGVVDGGIYGEMFCQEFTD